MSVDLQSDDKNIQQFHQDQSPNASIADLSGIDENNENQKLEENSLIEDNSDIEMSPIAAM